MTINKVKHVQQSCFNLCKSVHFELHPVQPLAIGKRKQMMERMMTECTRIMAKREFIQ